MPLTDKTAGKQRGKPFPKGVSPNPKGRPKGMRNKLGEAFLAALHDDFKEHGVHAVERVRFEKPEQYLKVIASLLPKEMNLNVNDSYNEMTDDELISRIRELSASFNAFLPSGDGTITEDIGSTASEGKSSRVH